MHTPITVMTWNVRYFGHGLRGLLATERGIRRAAHTLATLIELPDLVALQEVETKSLRAGMRPVPQIDRFRDLLNSYLASTGRDAQYEALYYPAHTYGVKDGPALYTTGLAILVGPRLQIEAHNASDPHEITHHKVSALRRIKQKRIVAHARVRPKEGGPTLDLFNTHMSLPAFFEVGPHRISRAMGQGSNQLAEVETLIDYVQQHAGEAAVIVGDFNTLPGSPAYRRIVQAGFQDAFAVANALEEHELHRHATAGFATERMHIDHVFATPGLAWDSVDGFPFGQKHDFHGLSDHTPKIGRLLLPNKVSV